MHLPIQLERNVATPLQDQLFEQLRLMIISGNLKPNSRVIATRFLAEQVGVSRTTVLLAYERLIAEGYLETRPAIGTYVCASLPDQPNQIPETARAKDIPRQSSLRPSLFTGRPAPHEPDVACRIDFRGNIPDFELLPIKSWLRSTQRILEHYAVGFINHPPPAGIAPLRRGIADWLAARRGIVVTPEQVIIVAGSQQAYNIVGRLFLKDGGRVVVETPAHADALCLFESMGGKLVHVPVDEDGIDAAQLPEGEAALAYVTPSHQNPLGSTLSLERRHKLIEWARTAGAYLIEDDCDGEFRYRGSAPLPLLALDPYGLVFYVGTFSKTLGAGLRLGYLIVPAELAEAATTLKALLDNGCPWLEQMVLADFMTSGEYDTHLRRLRKTYMARRDCLIGALTDKFGPCNLLGTEGGTHLTWLLPAGSPPARTVRDLARARGIGTYLLPDGPEGLARTSRFADTALLLGYSTLGERMIREGVAGLAEILAEFRPTH